MELEGLPVRRILLKSLTIATTLAGFQAVYSVNLEAQTLSGS